MSSATKKRRSMAERLSALATPAPVDVDAEDEGTDRLDLYADNDDSDDGRLYDDYAGLVTEPSALRRQLGMDVVKDDPKYKGKKVSRQSYFNEDEEDDDGEEMVSADEDEKASDDDEEQGSFDDEEAPTVASDESDEEELESDMGDSDFQDNDDDEERKLKEELERIQLEEEGTEVQAFSRVNRDEEIAKGQHTRNQLHLLDSVMETRIRLQQSLNICNRFAQCDARPTFVARGGDDLSEAIGAATAATTSLLGSLLDLQHALLQRSTDEGVRTATKKRKRPTAESEPDQYWKYIKLVADEYTPYRNSVLTKWHTKTTLASGGMGVNKQLKAINQGILTQVDHMLADREKLLQRTQLKRIALRPMGQLDRTEQRREFGEEIDKRANPENYDAEIFDDNDLYHQLLRDLISSRSRFTENDDASDMAQTWLEVQRLRSKVKKKVDTKASKGRKVRYTVMNELVNYMFPVEKGSADDATRTELCRSLFSNV